jgi:hypothetical protein
MWRISAHIHSNTEWMYCFVVLEFKVGNRFGPGNDRTIIFCILIPLIYPPMRRPVVYHKVTTMAAMTCTNASRNDQTLFRTKL